MTTYYVIRDIGTPGRIGYEQQVWHPSQRGWVPRDESDGFSRRYTSQRAAKRAAIRVGGDGVSSRQQYGVFWRVPQ